MTEENNVEQEEAEGQDVQMVFEGTAPDDLTECLEVSAKATIKDANGNVVGYKGCNGYFPFGKDLDDAVAKYTGEIVFSNYRAQAKIKLQAIMRSYLIAGKDIGDLLKTWKPGLQMERTPVDPMVAAENKFERLSPEEQKAFLEKLIARQSQQ
jgi:hypothetical protein